MGENVGKNKSEPFGDFLANRLASRWASRISSWRFRNSATCCSSRSTLSADLRNSLLATPAGIGGGLLTFSDLVEVGLYLGSSGGVVILLSDRSPPDATRADPESPVKRLPNSGSSGSFSSNAATLYTAGATAAIFGALPETELGDSSDSDDADSGSGSGSGFFTSGDFGGGGGGGGGGVGATVSVGVPYKFR